MKLDVPLIRQPKDTVDCAIAGLAMLFQYYGVDKTFSEIKKEIEVDAIGTYMPQLGTYMIKHGFEVEIVTVHPKLFTLQDKNMSKKEIITRLDDRYKNAKTEQDKKVITYFKEFVKAGGTINIKIPDITDVIEEIEHKRPVGAAMTTNFMNGSTIPTFNFHFNLITGYDKANVYANDPQYDELRGGKKKYTIQQFYYGMYASAYGDIDNASLFKVKKNKNNKRD